MIDQPIFQLRANRPALTDWSVWKTINIDGPDDTIHDLESCETVQKDPSDDELSLEPSYSDTLS